MTTHEIKTQLQINNKTKLEIHEAYMTCSKITGDNTRVTIPLDRCLQIIENNIVALEDALADRQS